MLGTAIKIHGKMDPDALFMQFGNKKSSSATTFNLPVKTYISHDGTGLFI